MQGHCQERTDDVLNMLNGNTVATLTFNQLHGGHRQNQDGSMLNQLYQYQQQRENTSGVPRGRLHATPLAPSS